MKNLSILLALFLLGSTAGIASTADDRMYRGYNNSFIFQENGIEFAVFPDGQFDFNYLDNGPNFSVGLNTANAHLSFNTGFNYDPFVQYDTYGAVIQIEEIPVFYDPYGRVNQIGTIFIDYRNGFVNRIGNLNVFYSRPGVIVNYNGFINTRNRFYVYRPWHDFYAVPLVNRRILWNNPYRRLYNPVRFTWNHHRNFWNRPGYYNGCFVNVNVRRNFYRPSHRVTYRSFERGRRDNRGRAIAYNSRSRSERNAIATGRRDVRRNVSTNRSTRSSNRVAESSTNRRNETALNRSNSRSRSNATTTRRSSDRSVANSTTANRNVSRARNTSSRSNEAYANTSRSRANARATRSNSSSQNRASARSSNTTRTAPATARTSSQRSRSDASQNRSSRNRKATVSSGNSRSKTSGTKATSRRATSRR